MPIPMLIRLKPVVLPLMIIVVSSIGGSAILNGAEFSLEKRLELAAENAGEIRAAWEQTPDDEQPGMQFLIEHMPERDLKELSSEFLREHVRFAYKAWREAPWKSSITEELFLNNILPYASVNEKRDPWRKDFYERCHEWVRDANAPGEAATILNNKIFKMMNVRYSTKRQKADQSPYESIESGLASCTGLSILLIDACRAVSVPARFVGTPLWADRSGNHTWVEVWDAGWHFTGAAEPTGNDLDRGWFGQKAAQAVESDRLHAIYAVSFKKTPLTFPCVWNRHVDYVPAINVTERYVARRDALPEGTTRAQFCAIDEVQKNRVACELRIESPDGKVLFEGKTKDEGYDSNDHALAVLKIGESYLVQLQTPAGNVENQITIDKPDQLILLKVVGEDVAPSPDSPEKPDAKPDAKPDDEDPIASLEVYLGGDRASRPGLAELPFANLPLTKEQVQRAKTLLWQDHVRFVKTERAADIEKRVLTADEAKMPFFYTVHGEKPEGGRSLFISMHGGGGAPKRVNDQQWENQKQLYKPAEGVYLAPRAPTDTWNLWHQEHIDQLFEQLIDDLVVLEDVNPNRVYLMGYSAGGDGVYQLAPRLADRWAACAMMAGHPNDASPLGLRNIGFAIYMGGKDAAYQRNEVAKSWQEKLETLEQNDPKGYQHLVTVYPEKGHWMDGEDKSALPWMAEFERNPVPKKVVWQQDDVVRPAFYWLAMDAEERVPGAEVIAEVQGQRIVLSSVSVKELTIRLDDRLLDLDQEVQVIGPAGTVLSKQTPTRTLATLANTFDERHDPELAFPAEVTVALP